jgi:hypothetical protein
MCISFSSFYVAHSKSLLTFASKLIGILLKELNLLFKIEKEIAFDVVDRAIKAGILDSICEIIMKLLTRSLKLRLYIACLLNQRRWYKIIEIIIYHGRH